MARLDSTGHFRHPVRSYLAAALIAGVACGGSLLGFGPEGGADVGMIFLLGVVIAALRFGFGPSLVTAVLSGALFAFFFAPPLFRFAISDLKHATTFLVMLGVAFVVSEQARRVRVKARESEDRRIEAEREALRNTLLSSVSHDLRTPLAAITGAASSLATVGDSLPPETRADLVRSILREAERMNRRVRDLLDMTRLESGSLAVQKEWEALEDVIGAALNRLDPVLAGRPIRTGLPEDLPLVPIDAQLVEQVIVNLIENAARYSEAGTPIEVTAAVGKGLVAVEVADRGPGIPPGEAEHVFGKFVRLDTGKRADGVGLGLAICRAIVTLHGGSIQAANRPGGGLVVRFTLPLEGTPPGIPSADVRRGEAP